MTFLFSQYTPKDLESEAEWTWHKPNYLTLTADHLCELFACWCCHMDPKGRSLELLDFTCSGLGNKQDSRLSYQNDKQHPSEGSSTHLYNTGYDSGFPRIQLGIGHSDCSARSLEPAVICAAAKIFRPQTRKFAATAPLSILLPKDALSPTFWILWIYLPQTSSLVFTFTMTF